MVKQTKIVVKHIQHFCFRPNVRFVILLFGQFQPFDIRPFYFRHFFIRSYILLSPEESLLGQSFASRPKKILTNMNSRARNIGPSLSLGNSTIQQTEIVGQGRTKAQYLDDPCLALRYRTISQILGPTPRVSPNGALFQPTPSEIGPASHNRRLHWTMFKKVPYNDAPKSEIGPAVRKNGSRRSQELPSGLSLMVQ